MMKKLFYLCAIIMFLSQAFSTFGHAGIFRDKIDKAEELSKLEGYKAEVSALLEQAILEDPSDAKSHFRAGEIYENIGYIDNASRCYRNAIRIDPSYKQKVVQKYFDRAEELLREGHIRISKRYFDDAIEISPGLKKEAEDNYFNSGSKFISIGDFSAGSDCFKFALTYNLSVTTDGKLIDYANVISPNDKKIITDAIINISKNKKVPILIITVPTIGRENLENYVYSIYEAWHSRNLNKTIIFISIKEKKIRIQQGEVIQLGITDEFCGKVIKLMVPYFKKQEFGKGLYNGVMAIVDVLNKNDKAQPVAAH